MWLTPIKVECYAGYKADETPRRVFINEQWIEVCDVLDRWHQGKPHPEWPLADYFKVLCENNKIYLIKHDLESDEWFYIKEWELK